MRGPILDVSRHNAPIDWHKAARRLLELGADRPRVAIRASVGDYYQDPAFAQNWQQAGEAGFARTAYHAVTPNRPSDAQVHNFITVTSGLTPDFSNEFSWVLDCELTRGQPPDRIAGNISAIAASIGGLPAIYTRGEWWNRNVASSPDWQKHPLWVAHYNTTIPNPTIPRDWRTWHIWQYSADGNGRGPEFGAASDSIDISRTKWELLPPPHIPTTVTVTAPALRIRSGPWGRITGATWRGATFHPRSIAYDAQGRPWYEITAYIAAWLTKPK